MLITIEAKDEKLNVNLSEDMTWPIALQMLSSTILNLAETTVDQAVKQHLQGQKRPKKAVVEAVRNSVVEDVADMMNFAFSNVLNTVCPKDPGLQVSEVAIATIENEIVHYAAEHNITLKEALRIYEEKIKEHPLYAKA